jgi:putative transcriptional regulator
MIKINIKDLLEQQGKTVYWLSKQTKISYDNLSQFVKGNNTMVRLDYLARICKTLNCGVEEVLRIEEGAVNAPPNKPFKK